MTQFSNIYGFMGLIGASVYFSELPFLALITLHSRGRGVARWDPALTNFRVKLCIHTKF